MKCPKCQTELTESDVEVVGIAPVSFENKGESFDIVVTCPECGNRRNGFLAEADMDDL